MGLRKSAGALVALLTVPWWLVPAAPAAASPTTTTLSVSELKPMFGVPVSVTVAVAGAQPGKVEIFVAGSRGIDLEQEYPVDAEHPTVSVALPLLGYGAHSVTASYSPTDSLAYDADSTDRATIRVQRDTTTVSTVVPAVRQGRRLVATSTVVSTHGQPVDGRVHFYLVKDERTILKSIFRDVVDGRARANLGKPPPDRYLVVTRYAGALSFKASNTVEQHVRVRRR